MIAEAIDREVVTRPADAALAMVLSASYPSSVTTAGRRRMAAVLFTDLVGSTELLSRLGEAAYDGCR